MKALYDETGFTMIEILVSINIAFILITLVIGMYLFITRFIGSTIIKTEQEEEVMGFVNNIDSKIKKAPYFELLGSENDLKLYVPDQDTLYIYSPNKENNIIDSVSLNITTDKEIICSDFGISKYNRTNVNTTIKSQCIKKMIMRLSAKKKTVDIRYAAPVISIKMFENIN